ncbi:MAG: hypothetical protein PHQ43_02725 [Dehalococcoidales bacterium]|nr:hypothetical protein [Dehalococcoidales bacterium]
MAGLGSNHITTTSAAVFLPEVWDMETLRATERALVMAPLVKRYDSLVSKRGDTVHIPDVSNLGTNEKSANTAVTPQTIVESETTISINKWYETSFVVEDIVKVQSNYDLMSEYTGKAKPTKTGLEKPLLNTGTAEKLTRGKQATFAVQPQRLSEVDPTWGMRQSELVRNEAQETGRNVQYVH